MDSDTKDCSANPAEPGEFTPVVDRRRCEGKKACVAVCPYDVFVVRTIDDRDYRDLPLGARIKSRIHGRQTAYTPNADACRACGLCVKACPEQAIRLVRSTTGSPA